MKKILQGALRLSPVAIISYAYCSTQSQITNDDRTSAGLKDFTGFKSRS